MCEQHIVMMESVQHWKNCYVAAMCPGMCPCAFTATCLVHTAKVYLGAAAHCLTALKFSSFFTFHLKRF